MAKGHWLLKTEPSEYAYADLERDRRVPWTGIRNYLARNHLRAMRQGDLALVFHTGAEKAVAGIARVLSAPGPDPTAPGEDWASVELGPERPLAPVPLAALKASKALRDLPMLKQGRLSVSPVTAEQFATIVALAAAPAPRAKPRRR